MKVINSLKRKRKDEEESEFCDSLLPLRRDGWAGGGGHPRRDGGSSRPLHPRNRVETFMMLEYVKEYDPDIEVWIWTGYIYEDLLLEAETDRALELILHMADVLVDGPYIQEKRDITLKARGSRNQRIIYLQPQ